MSYIELTGKETILGQFSELRKPSKNSLDITLKEGRVHLDDDDVLVLKAFLQRKIKKEKLND